MVLPDEESAAAVVPELKQGSDKTTAVHASTYSAVAPENTIETMGSIRSNGLLSAASSSAVSIVSLSEPLPELEDEEDKPKGWRPRFATPADSTLASQTHFERKPSSSLSSSTVNVELKTPTMSRSSSKSNFPLIPAVAEGDDNGDETKIRLGICAMDKKARSKPMAEILSRLDKSHFKVVFFGDDMILNEDIENWPVVDVLIAFYSNGYPLLKAKKYVELRKPCTLNDLDMQETLKDRRRVYDLLEASGIDVPRHVYLSRDGYISQGSGAGNGDNEQEVVEHDDHIELNGVIINKPFVEKPVDADDHNIAIYYPTSAGGGCKKLFRKVGDRSSEFYANINEVRRDGSYIYEEFVETQGTDVKMYTVGPEYGHAEARKSPTVDGKVERNLDGKEVRFPVILTFREKEIARRVVLGFKQYVCGFDLLRVQEGDSVVSYVCDVNGWSFVKNSRKYYDDCAQILSEHMLMTVKPRISNCLSTIQPLMATTSWGRLEDTVAKSPQKSHTRSISSTLKQVTSMLRGETVEGGEEEAVNENASGQNESVGGNDSTSMMKNEATTLEEGAKPVRDIPHLLVTEPISMNGSVQNVHSDETEKAATKPDVSHKEELRCVIAIVRHGDRTPKQKLKLNLTEPHILKYFHDHSPNCRKDLKVKAKKPMIEFLEMVKAVIEELESEKKSDAQNVDKELLYKVKHMRDVLERWKIVGLNRKLQIKPREWEEFENQDGETEVRCKEVQLILKWGGNLTKLGEKQSTRLGQRLRQELYPDAPGGGILRLHSTFRHDLKIKTSDEGRVMKTAAAFAKGLLELEGEIPPILVSLVHKEKDSIHMLDPSGNKDVQGELELCKEKINKNLQKDFHFDHTSVKYHEGIVGPASLVSVHKALKKVDNPRKVLLQIRGLVGELISQLEEMLGMMTSGDEVRIEGGEGLRGSGSEDIALSGVKLYKGETLLELTERWRFLYHRLYDEEKNEFDLSRIPDVHDNVRFDMLHNPHLGLKETLEKLYGLAKNMADCVVPQEYGSSIDEKRSIGCKMCRALCEKIKYDLLIAKSDSQSDMRYLINMDYSADLPINTLGRRVRTRLYFTSESHLHTLLNVLRFGASDNSKPVLSERGVSIVNETPELCYLTQIIIRLFEDPRREADDPRRFRVEIMFSPGATSTPMHMHELVRDMDNTRFETSGLQMISKEGLTSSEVEHAFEESIKAGTTEGENYEAASVNSTVDNWTMKDKKKNEDKGKPKENSSKSPGRAVNSKQDGQKSALRNKEGKNMPIVQENRSVSFSNREAKPTSSVQKSALTKPVASTSKVTKVVKEQAAKAIVPNDATETSNERSLTEEEENEDEEERIERLARLLARQYFWKSMAAVSFVLGIGCLFMSINVQGRQQRHPSGRM